MARYYFDKKNRAEDFNTISISLFTSWGHLKMGAPSVFSRVIEWKRWDTVTSSITYSLDKDDESREWYLRVSFTKTIYDEGKKEFDYRIALIATPCNYWGLRWWFIDPCDPMRRKCCVLYMQNNGYFASRKTLNLAYDSQSQRKWVLGAEMKSLKAIVLYGKIKYKYRNWEPTRKMKRVLKYLSGGLVSNNYTADDIVNSYFH